MYKVSARMNFVSKSWALEVKEIEIAKETEEKYMIADKEGYITRENMIYKTDEKEVINCGFSVLNVAANVSISNSEGYATVFCLDKDYGKEILQKALTRLCYERIEFFNSNILKLQDLN